MQFTLVDIADWQAFFFWGNNFSFQFIIGTGDNLSDFTFSQNVAHAHICAEEALNFQTVTVAGKVLIEYQWGCIDCSHLIFMHNKVFFFFICRHFLSQILSLWSSGNFSHFYWKVLDIKGKIEQLVFIYNDMIILSPMLLMFSYICLTWSCDIAYGFFWRGKRLCKLHFLCSYLWKSSHKLYQIISFMPIY